MNDRTSRWLDSCITSQLNCIYDTCCNCCLRSQHDNLTDEQKLSRWKKNLCTVDLSTHQNIENTILSKEIPFQNHVALSPPMGDDGEPLRDYELSPRKKGHVSFNKMVQQLEIENCLVMKDTKEPVQMKTLQIGDGTSSSSGSPNWLSSEGLPSPSESLSF